MTIGGGGEHWSLVTKQSMWVASGHSGRCIPWEVWTWAVDTPGNHSRLHSGDSFPPLRIHGSVAHIGNTQGHPEWLTVVTIYELTLLVLKVELGDYSSQVERHFSTDITTSSSCPISFYVWLQTTPPHWCLRDTKVTHTFLSPPRLQHKLQTNSWKSSRGRETVES